MGTLKPSFVPVHMKYSSWLNVNVHRLSFSDRSPKTISAFNFGITSISRFLSTAPNFRRVVIHPSNFISCQSAVSSLPRYGSISDESKRSRATSVRMRSVVAPVSSKASTWVLPIQASTTTPRGPQVS